MASPLSQSAAFGLAGEIDAGMTRYVKTYGRQHQVSFWSNYEGRDPEEVKKEFEINSIWDGEFRYEEALHVLNGLFLKAIGSEVFLNSLDLQETLDGKIVGILPGLLPQTQPSPYSTPQFKGGLVLEKVKREGNSERNSELCLACIFSPAPIIDYANEFDEVFGDSFFYKFSKVGCGLALQDLCQVIQKEELVAPVRELAKQPRVQQALENIDTPEGFQTAVTVIKSCAPNRDDKKLMNKASGLTNDRDIK